ncbi:MAG: hypothetical protein WC343_12470 [Bacilli bacterium]|jgi:hypothetical protein
MRITLSREKIADAILHNNETTITGGDRMGVFVWPNGRAEVGAVGRGTYYTGVDLFDPRIFVEITLSDDTTRWGAEAREERIKEGRIRDVFPDEMTQDEEDLISEYVDLYESVWREEIRYLSVIDDFEIEWVN